jgi:hypothetical protein
VRIKVSISFNPENGQYMLFRVESDGVSVPDGTHDDLHERITREIASEIDDNPEVVEEVPSEPVLTLEQIAQANAANPEILREDRARG